MCGIGGFFISPKSTLLTTSNIGKLGEFTTELLKRLESHGKDASGLAITRSDGVKIFKQPVGALELVELPSFKKFIGAHLTPKTLSVMVHTRLPTCGGTDNNANNHPVVHGDVVGVHNGIISNHVELFKKLKVKRIAEVDSEAIFALLNQAWDHEIKITSRFRDVDYVDGVVKTAPSIKGTFAYAAVNANIPDRMALVRSSSACAFVQKLQKEEELMVSFATSLLSVEGAGKSAGLWKEVDSKGYNYLTDDTMLSLKLNGNNEIEVSEHQIQDKV